MRSLITLSLALSLALAFACSDDSGTTVKQDGSVTKKDTGTPTPDVGVPDKIDCTKNTCYEYGTDKLLLPDATTQDKYAVEQGGKKYNSLGGILALLPQVSPDIKVQEEVDQAVCGGQAIVLFRVQSASLTSAAKISAQSWLAEKQACCTSTTDATKCCSEAKTTCFAGTTTFTAQTMSTDILMAGAINSGKLTLGPTKMSLSIPFSNTPGSKPLTLSMVGVKLSADISATGLANGILNGGIPKSELDSVLIPELATMINNIYTNPTTDAKTVSFMKTLFDTDKDGKITKEEIANNTMLKSALAGDVDVDGDGKLDLSLGVGFTAVKAKITTK